jgi:nitrogen regulatory protein PII
MLRSARACSGPLEIYWYDLCNIQKRHSLKRAAWIRLGVIGEENMKMILAILRPERMEEVQSALYDIGVSGLTVTEVRGGGQEKNVRRFRGFEYEARLAPKVRVEIAVRDDQADEVVEAMRSAASTGEVGDGKIFVYALDSCTRVRTGELGEASI